MTAPLPPAARRWAAGVFFTLLALWTWQLVEPQPVPPLRRRIPPAWHFVAAKTLHASAYAALAALGGVWPTTPAGRRAVAAGLLVHGAGTEIAQTFVPNRSGRAADVLIDWAGVGVGLTAVRLLMLPRLNRPAVLPTRPTG